MKQLTLSNRLTAIAALLGDRHGVADVGTDHGYLPVWLALKRNMARLVAADIRKGPLDRAEKTASDYGVSDKIEFVLTDGLSGLAPEGLDTVVIAGMGGETIVHILEGAPWTRSENVLCILQPQTKTDKLIAYLRECGFSLTDATLARDGGRLYLILSGGISGGAVFENPAELLLRKRDPLLPAWLDREIGKTRRALDGLALAEHGRGSETAEKRAALEALTIIKEETDLWYR